jgi:hypothetical protein
MTMLSRRTLLAVTLPAFAAGMARAEDAEDYPTRQVTFIVPFASAGGTDILARLLGQKLEQRLNKSFVIENRPGAGTVIATNFVVNSPPDGYTIAMTVSSLAIDVTLYKKLPYDPVKDLAMVALIASVPFVLVVSPSLPVTSVDDLIKLAKQRPLSYGSGGIGAFHHLAAALFCSMAGIKMTHVPYRGTAPALNDLIGGYIQRSRSSSAADQRRQGARAGGDHQGSLRHAARRSAARRRRRAGLQRRRVAGGHCAGENAQGHSHQAQFRAQHDCRARRGARAHEGSRHAADRQRDTGRIAALSRGGDFALGQGRRGRWHCPLRVTT